MTTDLSRENRLKRLGFRSWHRGTKEADIMIGCFFDRHAANFSEEELVWYERLMDEEDVEIMGWIIGTIPCPADYEGPMMDAMRKLDYIDIEK